ncbi:SDH family Clp fold serine proteinase [Parvularcula bermudensis]|nr:hypothetical protein [Parvularcula bermudensis]
MESIFIWGLFFVVLFVLPILARRQRRAAIETVFARTQRARKSRIIAIVHRQEPMGLLGIPQLRYIDLNDAEDVLNAIRSTPAGTPLEIILHTPGGLVLPALQIARAIKAHAGPKTVFVPHYAMSGGTLIALAADNIILNDHAVLGPIDPQIGGLPAASIAHVTETKSPDTIEDFTWVLADVARKAQQQLERAAKDLLSGTVSPNAAHAIAEELSSGRWTHDYPIDAAEAREIGLHTSTEMPEEIAALMELFPDKLSKQSVSYTQEPTLLTRLFGRRRPPQALPPPPAPEGMRIPFHGFAPGPGARSFSYGPWNPRDLNLGPGRGEVRPSAPRQDGRR